MFQYNLNLSDQSEKIFESLNSTGRKLSGFEYLRNNLFLRAGELGGDSESGDSYSDIFYREYWPFEEDENGFHYWDTDRLDSFLKAFLIAQLGPKFFDEKNMDLFDLYRVYSTSFAGGIEDEFKQLRGLCRNLSRVD